MKVLTTDLSKIIVKSVYLQTKLLKHRKFLVGVVNSNAR